MHARQLLMPMACLFSLLCSPSAQADSDKNEQPKKIKLYGENTEHVANQTSKARSRHSIGIGLNNNVLGYRYSFLGNKFSPYISVLGGATLGLEIYSEKSAKQSIDVFVGQMYLPWVFIDYSGAIWKWHPSGHKNSGLELGLGFAHIVGEAETFLTGSLGYKF